MASKVQVGDVLILLPGTPGSFLGRNGAVWAISAEAVLRAATALGGSLKAPELRPEGR